MTIFAIAPACAFMGVQSVGFVCAPHAGHPHIIAPAASRSSLGATLHYVTGHNASSQTRGGGRYLDDCAKAKAQNSFSDQRSSSVESTAPGKHAMGARNVC